MCAEQPSPRGRRRLGSCRAGRELAEGVSGQSSWRKSDLAINWLYWSMSRVWTAVRGCDDSISARALIKQRLLLRLPLSPISSCLTCVHASIWFLKLFCNAESSHYFDHLDGTRHEFQSTSFKNCLSSPPSITHQVRWPFQLQLFQGFMAQP